MSKSRDLGEFPAAALDIDASGNLDVTGTVTADGLTVDGAGITVLSSLVSLGDNTSYADLTFNSSDISNGTINFADATDSNVGRIQYDHSDNSLLFRVNDAERFRIDSAGNVGIGTSSPQTNLQINSNGGGSIRLERIDTVVGTGDSFGSIEFSQQDASDQGAGVVSKIESVNESSFSGYGALAFSTGAATSNLERLRIDSAGNVGIGTSSPSSYYMDNLVVAAANEGGITIASDSVSSGAYLAFADGTVGNAAYRGFINYSHGSDFMRFATGALERLRIDSYGNLALGSINAYSHRFFVRGSGADETVGLAVGANDTNVIRFYSSTLGTAGAIRVSAAGTSVAYNTSSDYRLKEDDLPMTGATERVKALRPINFAWKADGSRVDGFFAHELAEVVPEAASGTKDAMMDEEYEVTPAVYEDVTTPAVEAVLGEDGMVITEAVEESTESVLVTEAVMATRSVPDYQGIDQSKLVPLLTATIQELIARIEILEAK